MRSKPPTHAATASPSSSGGSRFATLMVGVDRQPAANGRDAVGQAEGEMAEPGEAFGVGIADQKEQRNRREREAERVELPG